MAPAFGSSLSLQTFECYTECLKDCEKSCIKESGTPFQCNSACGTSCSDTCNKPEIGNTLESRVLQTDSITEQVSQPFAASLVPNEQTQEVIIEEIFIETTPQPKTPSPPPEIDIIPLLGTQAVMPAPMRTDQSSAGTVDALQVSDDETVNEILPFFTQSAFPLPPSIYQTQSTRCGDCTSTCDTAIRKIPCHSRCFYPCNSGFDGNLGLIGTPFGDNRNMLQFFSSFGPSRFLFDKGALATVTSPLSPGHNLVFNPPRESRHSNKYKFQERVK
ncbi:hypothetical protein AB6A40_008895 [Gnathostoma spinigerum]|uniref:Uncharacterized protein n=1 Tax=Gnathostoma spinigerum TaxID=75299 RepID=A0ABD6ES84_9BILA